jgi:hypothetical protein
MAGTLLLTGCGGVSRSSSAAPVPALAASASTLAFGSVAQSKSSNLTETLTNNGGSPVTISAANISGAGFSVSGPSLPITLAASQRATFTVTFAPASSGSASGTLAIVSTAANPTLDIALAGSAITLGQLSVSPASLNFGNVVVAASSSLNGTLQASVSSVTISAASSGGSQFELAGISLPVTLAPGQSASFSVTFNPATAGAASASLSFASDAANSPTAQALAGNGIAATPHSVGLSWNASTGSGVIGYNVYRGSTSGGPYLKINDAPQAGTAYTDSSVSAGQTYYYVTTAFTSGGDESSYSNQVDVVVPLS